MPIRYYQTGNVVTTQNETVNLVPLKPPTLSPFITVTPHGSTASYSTSYATYNYPVATLPYGSNDAIPAMYHYSANVSLTFQGKLLETNVLVPNIVEWYWEFGDGISAVGISVAHTYRYASKEMICNLRVTDEFGNVGNASLNMLLVP